MNHRIFFGLALPVRIKNELASLQFDDATFVRQSFSNLHITVCFVGAVTPEKFLRLCLSALNPTVSCFQLRFGRIAVFPLAHAHNSVCVSVEPDDKLIQLRSDVRKLLGECSIRTAHVDYKPHVTLGWTGKSQPDVINSCLGGAEIICEPVLVDHLSVFESFGVGKEKVYRRIKDIPL
jgi:2'-5' RNA ligase